MLSHRFTDIDLLVYRQLLGDISKQEIKEVNRVFGGMSGLHFTKGIAEPASILAYRWIPEYALAAGGVSLAAYARFVKGYNILWFGAAFLPLLSYRLYGYNRQPNQ